MMMRYFKISEFACKCCSLAPMNMAFLAAVDELRHRYGKPLVVTSGYRCARHNQAVSKTGVSGPHTTGKAADFAVGRGDAYELTKLAFEMGFTGIGFQQKGEGRFIHLDTLPNGAGQPRPTIWNY